MRLPRIGRNTKQIHRSHSSRPHDLCCFSRSIKTTLRHGSAENQEVVEVALSEPRLGDFELSGVCSASREVVFWDARRGSAYPVEEKKLHKHVILAPEPKWMRPQCSLIDVIRFRSSNESFQQVDRFRVLTFRRNHCTHQLGLVF